MFWQKKRLDSWYKLCNFCSSKCCGKTQQLIYSTEIMGAHFTDRKLDDSQYNGLQWRQPHFCYPRGRVWEKTTLMHFCHMQYMQHCRRMTRGWGQPVMDYSGAIHTFVIKEGGYEKRRYWLNSYVGTAILKR